MNSKLKQRLTRRDPTYFKSFSGELYEQDSKGTLWRVDPVTKQRIPKLKITKKQRRKLRAEQLLKD